MCSSSAVSVTLRRISSSGVRRDRRAQRKGEIVVDGEMRIERILLEHEGDVARRRRQARDIARRRCESRRGPGVSRPATSRKRRRLARARSARAARRTRRPRSSSERSSTATMSPKRLRDAVQRDLSHARPPRAARVRIARPLALSNSDSFSGRNARPSRSPTRTARLRRRARAQRPEVGGQRHDLRGAEIFDREHRAAQRARVVEQHRLRPHAERQLALAAATRAASGTAIAALAEPNLRSRPPRRRRRTAAGSSAASR